MQHDSRLDGIRGLAVLLVILHHGMAEVPATTAADRVVLPLTGVCWFGVDLFFVLSGFLITGILLRNRNEERYFSSFYARRILRIFPLYYCILPLILFAAAHYGGAFPSDAVYDVFYLSNVHNAILGWPSRFASHLWSLSVEEQFYFVWPTLIFLTPPRWIVPVLIALGTALAGTRIAVSSSVSSTAIYNLFHFDGLIAGALLAALEFRQARLHRPAVVAVFSAATLVLICVHPVALGLDWQHWTGFQTISYTLIAVAGAALIAMTRAASNHARLSGFFGSKLLVAFGKFSYAIYLVHYPLDTLVRKLGFHPGELQIFSAISPLPSLIYTTALAGASFGVSQITWNLLEKRCLALKKYFEYKTVRHAA